MWKKIIAALVMIVLGVILAGVWLTSLLEDDSARQALRATQPEDLDYLQRKPQEQRGKILAVVTNVHTMGPEGKYTGYELTELARAYYVFEANGFSVDIASPRGGEPPAVIDGDDMGRYDYAFLNDRVAQQKVSHSLPMATVNPDDYQAVYFVGGKGAMFDFPDNPAIQALVRDYYEQGKVIGAVCHGPAALVNVKLANGQPLLAGKSVTGFTNAEELLLIPGARDIFPFLLQDKLTSRGGLFNEGDLYLNNISQDHHLLTGQNPWSVWTLAEEMISQLGYRPVPREITAEENTVAVLQVYETQGYSAARESLRGHLLESKAGITRNLIVMHSLVAAMQWRMGKAIDLIGLARLAKHLQ